MAAKNQGQNREQNVLSYDWVAEEEIFNSLSMYIT